MIPSLKIEFENYIVGSTVIIKFDNSKQLSAFIKNEKRIFKTNISNGWTVGYGTKYRKAIFEVTKINKIKQKQIIAEVKEITLRDRNLDIILN